MPLAPSTRDGMRSHSIRTHMALVRSYLSVAAFDRQAREAMLKVCVEASRVREDLADIINAALEELVRLRYELPGFSTLLRGARLRRAGP